MNTPDPLKIAIAGASGRMGRMLIEAISNCTDCVITGALDTPTSSTLGQDAGFFLGQKTGIHITADLHLGLQGAQVLIDFTRPEGTLAHMKVCRELGVNAVIGTTGFTEIQKQELVTHAKHVSMVMAPNMSVGVNVMLKLLATATPLLSQGYDIEIIESHHRHKVDAPSGTALKMGEVVAQALGRDLKTCAVYGREGVTGERDPNTIGFATVRAGDIIGEHTVLFAGNGERIEISHKSSSRANYAAGSLRAALFLRTKAAGLFSMDDVLGFVSD